MKLPDNADIGTREDFAIEKFQLAAQFIKDAHALYLAESNSSAVNRAYYQNRRKAPSFSRGDVRR